MPEMEELIGKKILSVEIDKIAQHYLVFNTDVGKVFYVVDGDCCSESWFYRIENVDNLIGSVIEKVEDIPGVDIDDGKSRQDEDSLYGIKLFSSKGMALIEYRNSSNGYYGGSCVNTDRIPVSSDEEVELISITQDYIS